MRWYTAIGMKKDDADGRFCVWVDGEEKVLTEMETILWAALTWSFCEEDKVHSQMHRLLVFSLGEKQAQEWADKEDFQFLPEPSGKAGPGCADRRMYQRGSCIQHYQPVSHVSHGLFTDRTHEAFYGSPFHGKRTEVFTEGF